MDKPDNTMPIGSISLDPERPGIRYTPEASQPLTAADVELFRLEAARKELEAFVLRYRASMPAECDLIRTAQKMVTDRTQRARREGTPEAPKRVT
jgi:hypothetical protein